MTLDVNFPDPLNAALEAVLVRDRDRLGFPEYFSRWLFAERLHARGARAHMGFSAYEGTGHIAKFFNWHTFANYADYFCPEQIGPLQAASVAADLKVYDAYGLENENGIVQKVGRYNAQDFLLMRGYAVPERNRVRVQLDFGAGHGRLANLAFNAPNGADRLKTYIAVEAIPSTYFTQLAYFRALDLKTWEYLEHCDEDLTSDTLAAAIEAYDVVHLPTWRHDLLPDGCVDMVTCVQVLKELPGPLVNAIIPIFARLTHETGAIYIRDHQQFHNPNHMPIDLLLQTNGFALEFAPQLIDRTELHGMPRIWRKVNPAHFIVDQYNA